ncbi:NAD(P)/FAD-dependent oxidoreductase [Halomonas salifodinae]|uniref:NAD(P)/FAD-dependent oxidoreductase n=1 Tax=Halomonas salifodinae TaxID=438745 RepID=A0ABW2F0R7_9GAMM
MKINNLPADDDSCGWTKILPKHEPRRLEGPTEADWVIVGAGFTGLAAARQLAAHRPDDTILLVDAQCVADGASGRNSGFLIDLPHDLSAPDYIGDLKVAGMDLSLNRAAIGYLREIVEEEGIDCDWRACGKVQAAVNDKGIKVLEAYRSGLERLGAECHMVNTSDMQSKLGTSYYKQGLYTPGTVLVQPAALARGLARTLPENVQLCELTPVTRIEHGSRIQLHTPAGMIKTRKLILTNNVFAQEFGYLSGTLLPIFTYAGLTRPLTEAEQQRLGGDACWGVIPADPFGSTVRRTPDQRILVRNSFSFNPGGKSSPTDLENAKKHIVNGYNARFPMLDNVEMEYSWGGVMCMSRNHAPYFGELGKNVFGVGGHNGIGVTKGTITGKLIADHLANKDSDLLRYMLSQPRPAKNPPRPLLDIGVAATLMYNQWRAGPER